MNPGAHPDPVSDLDDARGGDVRSIGAMRANDIVVVERVKGREEVVDPDLCVGTDMRERADHIAFAYLGTRRDVGGSVDQGRHFDAGGLALRPEFYPSLDRSADGDHRGIELSVREDVLDTIGAPPDGKAMLKLPPEVLVVIYDPDRLPMPSRALADVLHLSAAEASPDDQKPFHQIPNA